MNYLERALFIVGNQNDGKSSQIRDIFRDHRLHNNGISRIGDNGRLFNWYSLSNERWLQVRLTSPHEYGEGFEDFSAKIDANVKVETYKYRWNFLSALQTNAINKMPNSEEVVLSFKQKYNPERVRILLIHTGYNGKTRTNQEIDRISSFCKSFHIEFSMIDARIDNGLIVSDFFDFT